MFGIAITKQQKLIKLYKQLIKSDKDLHDSFQQYRNKYIDNDELLSLAYDKLLIDLEEIAIHFDAIKYQIDNFNVLLPNQLWKLDKPTCAEGAVFSTPDLDAPVIRKIPAISIRLVDNATILKNYRQRIAKYKTEGFLSTALYTKKVQELTDIASLAWASIDGPSLDDADIPFAIDTIIQKFRSTTTYTIAVGPNDDIPMSVLQHLAKHFKINIIV